MKITNLFLFCIVALLGRVLYFGTSIGDAIVFTTLCGAWAYDQWLSKQAQPDVNEDLRKELDAIKNLIGVQKMTSVIQKSTKNEPAPRYF